MKKCPHKYIIYIIYYVYINIKNEQSSESIFNIKYSYFINNTL